MDKEFTYIGKRVPRVDSLSRVTGEAVFAADLKLPRMLVGKVKRSHVAHARIVRVDTSKAERLRGVKAVVTGRDTAGVKWGVFRYTQDMEFLPRDKVRYFGEEIAAVAAVDEDTALEALELIEVELEELPAVFTPLDAMASEGPWIHDEYPNNVNVHVEINVGDVEKGFEESYLVREDTFTAAEDDYFMGEPFAVVARFDDGGNLEMWTPNAGPHMKAKPLSNALRMPLNKVRVRKIAIGGAFGGRSEISPADYICALLARKSARPVKLIYTREENTVNVRMGHALITTIKTGVDREGRVLARDITCYMDGGAYSSTGPIATSVPFLCMEQAYRMENVRYNGYRIFTNKPVRGMIRMHGRSFACGVDLQLDRLGEELGIDPVTMRLRNARKAGETTPTGSVVSSCGLTECIEKAAEKIEWRKKYGNLPPWRGIGIGINSVQTGFPLGIRGGSQAFIKFNEDGGVTLNSGVVDNGQGNDPADLVLKDRKIFVAGSPDRFLPLTKVVRMGLIQGRPVSGEGHFAPKVDHRREWVSNPHGQLSEAFSFGATVAEVEVDPDTGQVRVLEVAAAQDCGFAINPMVVEGQFEGSVAMGGQGGMLTEYHFWDGGRCMNPTQLEYKVPLAADMPRIHPIIVESNDPGGPYGAKEAGMSIAMSAAQAYASAIADAIGVTITDFPMTPDKILEAIEKRRQEERK
ncbi:MAG: molybdopterin-dependent oxidoreductase [Deltaproteobacteria bacterium]|nr:molybdopterin-dependent oxidoreductase [Deltaproteobacteria bacterium]